ncbi:carbohydrate ABC transporter permease [Cohnella sp.]|uniref:carbohydrate ABC transporter permease n=1 Tax=Cohnella sp. TaxID=1883426 RepID=UPI003562140D
MRRVRVIGYETLGIAFALLVFGAPFYFMIVNAGKDAKGASLLNMEWPSSPQFWENIRAVIEVRDYLLVRAFVNSTALTLFSIVFLVLFCAMAGFVLQRRRERATPVYEFLILSGLIIPPAIVPTIWVLDGVGLFKTLLGLILVEVALGFPFSVLLYKNFMATVPREIDEAAILDGCGGLRLFFRIIMPLLQPVTATIVVLSSVTIFNDFTNPLYFLPGARNVTVQLTLYNFQSQFVTQYNLLFANILLITIPPFILFLIFNKRIVAGMTAGSLKA